MSVGQLIGAGLAAGAANLILGFTFAHLVGVEKIQDALRAHNLRVIGEPSDAIPHTLVRFLLGIGATLLFWAVSARFTSPPVAAVVAGTFAWTFVYAYTAWGHYHIGLFPTSLAWMLAGWGLIEMIATSIMGGWVATGSEFWK